MAGATTPRAGTTTAAAVITIVVTVLWTLLGIGALVIGLVVDQSEVVDEFDVTGDLRDAITTVFVVAGLVILAISVWCLVLAVKVLQRKRWARTGTIVTFSIFFVLALLGLVGSFGAEDGNQSPGPSVLGVLAYGAVVGLLLSRPSKEDFDRAEAAERYGTYGGYGGPPADQWGQQGWGQPQPQQQWGGGWGQPPAQQPHGPGGSPGWGQPGWGQPPSSTPPPPPDQGGWAAPPRPGGGSG